MCIEVWRRPPCGHSVYQNTFQCDHAHNEDEAIFADVIAAEQSTHNYEDELYHVKTSPAELRRRRQSSLSMLSGSSPSAGASMKSPCRLTRAVRPVQERECAECFGIWRESQWRRRQQQPGMEYNGWSTLGNDYFEEDGAAAGHDGFMFTGEGRLGSMSPGSPGGSSQHWAPRPENSRRHRSDARRQSGAAARRLENAFFMIAQRQAD